MPRKGLRTTSYLRARELTAQMEAEGFTGKMIAKRLRVNERTVKRYKAENRGSNLPDATGNTLRAEAMGNKPERSGPVPFEELPPAVQWAGQDSPEGFRDFNDLFWPEERMPEHILAFARSAYSYVGACERDKCGHPAAYRTRHGLLCHACAPAYIGFGGKVELKGRWKTRVVLNVPPGHGKTTYFTVRMCSWRLCYNRSWRIIVISETDVIAKTMVQDVAGELENPEGLAETFGPFRGETNWGPGHARIRVIGSRAPLKDASVFGRGVTTQINGLRADEIMCDDLVSRESCKTPERRQDAEDGYTSTIVSRLVPGGIVRVIGTRWHMDDLYAVLTSKKRQRLRTEDPVYEHVNFPAVLDWEREVTLWPSFWSFERLMMEKYDEMPSQQFNLVYQQQPAPPGSTLVEYAWIYGRDDDIDPNRGCLDRGRVWGYQPPREGWVRLISVDPSPTMFWGIVVADVAEVTSESSLYEVQVLEVVRAKLDVRAAMAQFARILRTYSPRYVVAEINSWRGWLRDDLEWRELQRRYSVTVVPHVTTIKNKDHALYGIETLSSDFEHGRIRLPYSGPESVQQAKYVIEEALNYPFYATTDVLMALWFPKANLLALRNRRMPRPTRQGGWHVPPRLAKRSWLASATDGPPEFLVPAGSQVTIPIGDE